MKDKKTSRILNDESFILGLSYNDISGLGLLMLVLIIVFKILNIKSMFWILILTLLALMALIPVRMTYRRKFIRDFFSYLFRKGVIHVSKNNRNNTDK